MQLMIYRNILAEDFDELEVKKPSIKQKYVSLLCMNYNLFQLIAYTHENKHSHYVLNKSLEISTW